jgi:ParB family chromosome partitioning protein
VSKRGLGKGINSLIGDYTFDDVVEKTIDDKDHVQHANIADVISNPGQPRKSFDPETLQELAESIKKQGIIQPVIVEKRDGSLVIVAGERRVRAARLAGLEKVPVIIKTFTEGQRLEVALIENIQRENLNPIEEAKAYRYLMDRSKLNQEDLSARLGKKRSTIANSVRLLNLPKQAQNALISRGITAGHARAILSVVNPSEQTILLNRIITEHLSVRQAEELAAEYNNGARAKKERKQKKKVQSPPEIAAVEEKFLDACGTKVKLKGSLSKGAVQIEYYSPEDLERIYSLISKKSDLFD